MRIIKVYLVKSFAYTPFQNKRDIEYLEQNGVSISADIKDSDIIISQNLKHLKPYFLKYPRSKKFLVWTFEPRFDISFKSEKNFVFGAVKCHFMNVYTGDVFSSPLVFHLDQIKEKLEIIGNDFKFSNRKIVALMSYFKGIESPPLLRNGENIDLIEKRSRIALEGQKINMVDIFGKGWPKGISIEDSRDGQWKGPKLEILKKYHFNLCFENTIASNYITEKIWDSISSYCLPIYFGRGTNIYDLFPENSFIDYSKINDPNSLFDIILNISKEEYIKRLNKCIKVFNSISSQQSDYYVWIKRKHSLNKIIEKFKEITNT